jgi:hypothetical protein
MERNMADHPAGSQKIQVKVLDAASGKELSSHEMVVAPGTSHGFCTCCTTTVLVPGPVRQ